MWLSLEELAKVEKVTIHSIRYLLCRSEFDKYRHKRIRNRYYYTESLHNLLTPLLANYRSKRRGKK